MLSIQVRNETEDDDMDQDTPDSDRLHDNESESAPGTDMKQVHVCHPLLTPKRVGLETLRRKVIACYVEENEVKLNVEQL